MAGEYQTRGRAKRGDFVRGEMKVGRWAFECGGSRRDDWRRRLRDRQIPQGPWSDFPADRKAA